jgi:hypothetical protein
MANNQLSNVGLFVPTTYTVDVTQLHTVNIPSPEFKELLVRLYQNINSICTALNLKDSGYYVETEFMNSQLLFPNPNFQPSQYRQIFRTVVNFGTLPNNTSTSVAHNIDITNTYTFTRIYGAASDTTNLTYIPLPYVSTTSTNNIELSVNATDVTITTTFDYSSYTTCYVILEYVKQ